MIMTDNEKKQIETAILNIKSQLPAGVTLLAATKTVSPEKINFAARCGITVIGENRVNELLEKYDEIDKSLDVHFIGRLQTNKVKYIVDKVSMIHSVDSEKLAAEIDRQCKKIGKVMDVLIEINIGGEESKGGIMPDEAYDFVKKAAQYSNIRVAGLMTIPPVCITETEQEKYFIKIKQIFIDIAGKKEDNINMSVLSMGMSGDYAIAARCGSTLVRVGSAIFGTRDYK